jgi:serine/threonine protein kinase
MSIYKNQVDPGKDYQLKQMIGHGGYCNVYVALHQPTGNSVAIKRYKDFFKNSEDTRNILKEMMIFRVLSLTFSHRFPKVKDLFVTEADLTKEFPFFRTISMAIEVCDMDLRRLLISDRPLSYVQAKTLCFKMVACVYEFHCRGLFHRDLKPENFLINLKNLDVKLTDFNHAMLITQPISSAPKSSVTKIPSIFNIQTQRKKLDTKILGTRYYRAPEILLFEDYDYRIDVWGLGCIIWEVMAKVFANIREPLFVGKYCETISPTDKENIANNHQKPKMVVLSEEDQLMAILKKLGRQMGEPFSFISNPNIRNFLAGQNAKMPKCSITGPFEKHMVEFALFEDMIKSCLSFNPQKRISIDELLCHDFFSEFDPFEIKGQNFKELVFDWPNFKGGSTKDRASLFVLMLKELNYYHDLEMYEELVEPFIQKHSE